MQDGIRAKRNAMQLREVVEHALLADRPETAESLRMDRIIGTPPDSLDSLAPTAGPESKVSPSLLRAKASVERPRHTRKTPAACMAWLTCLHLPNQNVRRESLSQLPIIALNLVCL